MTKTRSVLAATTALFASSFIGASPQASTDVQPSGAKIDSMIQSNYSRYEAFFQDLHQNPELSMEEYETSKKLAEALRTIGFQVTEKVGKTGVVGVYKNGKGPTILIRADMDALPMPEETKLSYASKKPGVMHACGHDFHVTSTLAAVDLLVQLKDLWKGTLLYVGQPGEELGIGAKSMMQDGLYKRFPRPDVILGLHTAGIFDAGIIRIKPGPVTAANDSFDVTLFGKGSHGSMPHLSIDPISLFAEFKVALDHMVAREIDGRETLTVTIGKVSGGTKRNIISDNLKAEGLIRTYNPEIRKIAKARLVEIANGVAALHGAAKPTVTFLEQLDVVSNDLKLHDQLRPVFENSVGKDRVLTSDPIMGAEDFGILADEGKIPSLFWWVGTGDPKKEKSVNHSSKFKVDFKPAFPAAVKTVTSAVLHLAR